MKSITDLVDDTVVKIEKLNVTKDDVLIIKTDFNKFNRSDFNRFIIKLTEQFPDRLIIFSPMNEINFESMPIGKFFDLMKVVQDRLFPPDEDENKEDNS